MPKNENKINNRNNDLLTLLAVAAIIFLANVIGRQLFYRLDLTSEKRYTLSDNTKKILRGLDDEVFVKVYLDGDLNIPFKKFQDNIRDILDEFKVYGKDNFQYEFVNPLKDIPNDQQGKIITELYNKGLQPTNIHQRDKDGGVSEKIIFPSAMISYKNIDVPLNLLINNTQRSAQQNLNASTEELEYNFISLIKSITNKKTEKIAFLEGQGELNEYQVGDITKELAKSYQVDRGSINGKLGVLDNYKAVIIAKPTKPFTEPDKFVIDQYIMHGGKVLWLIDAVQVSLDSLINGETMAFIKPLNIDDLLFKYGVRINPVLVEDLQSAVIPVNVALKGNTPNFQPSPWFYFPLVAPYPGSPITQHLNLVECRFVNDIDTIAARKDVKKTPLLVTSDMSRTREVPCIISLDEIREKPKKQDFNTPYLLTGVLLEGKFESAFVNRGMSKYFAHPPKIKKLSVPNKMAVIADGDIIRNDVRYTPKGPALSPLGFDRYTRQTYGNKDFLVNLIQYLADNNNLLKLRGREIKLRLLNKNKITEHRVKWILINMIAPSILVLIFGAAFLIWRRFRYSR